MKISRKTIDLELALRPEHPQKTVKAYTVLPGLFAHRSITGDKTWSISHHSGYGISCSAPTLKEVRRIAREVQKIKPIDWTQDAKTISSKAEDGGDWVSYFMNMVNGYPLEYNEQPDSHRCDDSDTSPFDQLYWQGEPVWMPDDETLRQWFYDGICESLDGHRVELDGYSPNGAPSYFIALGMI